MLNATFYLSTVLIWGSTWLAIKYHARQPDRNACEQRQHSPRPPIPLIPGFGSVIAFGCYLTLIGRIGAGRAAYATLLFPIVALLLSTFWENYHWALFGGVGMGLILSGNYLALASKRA